MVEKGIGSQAQKPLELHESMAGTVLDGGGIIIVDAKCGLFTLDRSHSRYV